MMNEGEWKARVMATHIGLCPRCESTNITRGACAIGAVPPGHIKETVKHEEKSGVGDRATLTFAAGIGHTFRRASWSPHAKDRPPRGTDATLCALPKLLQDTQSRRRFNPARVRSAAVSIACLPSAFSTQNVSCTRSQASSTIEH